MICVLAGLCLTQLSAHLSLAIALFFPFVFFLTASVLDDAFSESIGDSKFLVTCSADMSCNLYEVSTGKLLQVIKTGAPARSCRFSEGGGQLMVTVQNLLKEPSKIFIYDFDRETGLANESSVLEITDETMDPKTRFAVVRWCPLNERILAGCEDGTLRTYDPQTGKLIQKVVAHEKCIRDIQWNKEKTLFITCSVGKK